MDGLVEAIRSLITQEIRNASEPFIQRISSLEEEVAKLRQQLRDIPNGLTE